MTDQVDLSKLDSDALYTIVLLHEQQIEWYRKDIERVFAEMNRRNHLKAAV